MAAVRHVGVSALILAALMAPSLAFAADIDVGTTLDGSRTTGRTAEEMAELGTEVHGAVGAKPEAPWSKFATTSYCAGDRKPGAVGADELCGRAVAACVAATDPAARGPAVRIWSALVNDAGEPVDAANNPVPALEWRDRGHTCLPQLVPGATNTLTMALIINQFHDTAFAKAEAGVQPVKGTTLVNLPTFYAIQWPEAGFGPDEIDTTTLVGRQVQIRPTFKSANYVYGDGHESGPVASFGGVYPEGDIRHTYAQSANVNVRIDVTYGGQFSVSGGEWIDIPDEVTIQGTPFALRVAEARAQLVR